MLANLLSKALSSDATTVSIGAVDGVLSSNASISDIVLSDRDGPWLKVDKAKLVWSRLALLSRRLEVDELTIGHIQFLRRPLPSEDAAAAGFRPALAPARAAAQGGRRRSSACRIFRSASRSSAWRRAFRSTARRRSGPPSEGLDLTLSAKRLDAPGEFKALMTYVPATDKLTVAVNSEEPAGGHLRPSRQPARPAAGPARPQRRGPARQFRRQARFRRRRGRVGEGRHCSSRGRAPGGSSRSTSIRGSKV